MAGSIVFRSGASWDVSSLMFRYALGSLKSVLGFTDERAEYLHLAAQFGFLVFEDVPEPVRSQLLAAVETEQFSELVSSTATEAEGYALDNTRELVGQLQSLASTERSYPSWLSCTPRGIIVDGLSVDDIVEATQLPVWPVIRVDDSDGSPLKFSFTLDNLEVELDLSDSPQGHIDLGDAKLTIHNNADHDPNAIIALGNLLVEARQRAGKD